ncbi:MAG: hypothetical protein WCX27_01825 [Candidatus Paceibacterota bacterium]|jgi:hypothetical protein
MNFIMPIILILSSLAVFFGYVDPNYKGSATCDASNYSSCSITSLKDELAKYGNIAKSSNTIVARENALIEEKNKISDVDQERMKRFIPDNIDNIRLIVEISKIVEGRGLVAKGITVGDIGAAEASAIGQTGSSYGTLSVRFTVTSSYANFFNLLNDLQNNLRLTDVTDISFTSTDSGFYDFSIGMNMYWLK